MTSGASHEMTADAAPLIYNAWSKDSS